jgi:AcrR family transcriptional regulator
VPSVTSSCQGSTRNFLLTVAVEHDGGYGAFVERKRVQLRREEILSATVRQIQGHGIAALRIADVAAVLGVSPALVIYHFQTKENLVAEAFRHAAEHDLLKVNRLVRGSGSVPSRLMSTLGWYAPTGRARGWLLWIDGWATAMRDHTLAEVISDLDEQWRQAIADLISEGVAAGDFTVEDPQEASARRSGGADPGAWRWPEQAHDAGVADQADRLGARDRPRGADESDDAVTAL